MACNAHVAVNVSSVQFARGNLVATLRQALAASGLRHDRLEVEITESVFLDNSEDNLSILKQLHEMGVKVALDDFGTGYSALGYLLAFPFDKIKIDGSFVRALDTTPGAHIIMRAVSEVGKPHGHDHHRRGHRNPQQLRNVPRARLFRGAGLPHRPPMSRDNVRKLLFDAYHALPELKYPEPMSGGRRAV